jgi:thiol-disulfide isomerase/thioredoxin
MNKLTLVTGLIFTSLFSLLSLAEGSENTSRKHLDLLTISQGNISFNDYQGKVVLLDFWASWCRPCRQSFPWMNDMQARYADQGLIVLAVNLDQDKADASDFLKDVPAKFRIIYDQAGGSAEQMEVIGMPMSYLIDRNGDIRHSLIGFNSQKKIQHEAHIHTLLNEATR